MEKSGSLTASTADNGHNRRDVRHAYLFDLGKLKSIYAHDQLVH
jgi:hypothetical protein